MGDRPDLRTTERLEEVRMVSEPSGATRERVVHDRALERVQRVSWAQQLIWVMVGVVDTLIGLRVFLKVIGANPDNPFARFIYSLSDLFAGPFAGLVPDVTSGKLVLEVSALVAMVVYALVGLLLDRLVWLAFIKPRARTIETETHKRET